MFEFLFKYPATIFHRGHFVLLTPWPVWILVLAVLVAAGALFWHIRRHQGWLTGSRSAVIWLLETCLIALVLFLLWHPAISIATLKQQQNVIAVLLDDSRSMAIKDTGETRLAAATDVLNKGLLDSLGRRFQVRLYRIGKDAQRISNAQAIQPVDTASRLGDSLKEVLDESSTLPLGAVVLLSDGADNSGGIDLDTINRIRRQRIPVHTIGFGRERPSTDLEITDVDVPARTYPDSRLRAQVTFREYGLSGRNARLSIRDGNQVLASQEVVLGAEGTPQTEEVLFNAGSAGPKNVTISIDPLDGEENRDNNTVTRLVNVESNPPRILYVEGEPRWGYKFIRRAADDDRSLQLVSMLRTTQNKIYRQGISNPKELEDGFPSKAEDLFVYQGLIIGSVDVNYFTSTQQELIREFANRRGGGILFLGGRFALSDGGWATSQLAELLPVRLPDRKGTFHRDQTGFELTAAGRESLVCRLDENVARNLERWKKMPLVANYNEVGESKPGAVVLMELKPAGKRPSPMLVTENYGLGRTALFATAGSWRWKMWQDHTDRSHATFWQQLMRYLVSGAPGQVTGSTPHPVLPDDTRVRLRAEVRDKQFRPVASAKVEARIVGPGGQSATVLLPPQPLEEGAYTGEWTAEQPGSYVAEIVAGRDQEEIGRDVIMFRREDGVAENFHTSQNRELLEKLSEETGGRYYTPSQASRLTDEISYSEAGITIRETRDLWDMPVVFLLALLLRGTEWVLRRKWGVV